MCQIPVTICILCDIWPEFDAGAHIPVPFGVLQKISSFWQSFPCILGPNCVPTYNLTL